jgi:CheY-like chemotaxis protein
MKNKRILLVEDKYEDIIAIQDSLKSLNGQHTLHVVHNINDALQVLMGGSSHYGMENYSQTGKVRPDIVLLNIAFLQENAREFLEVMQKYYSLKNIKVYITGDQHEVLDPQLAIKYGIAGYLSKPLDLQNTVNESVLSFRMDLQKPGKALFSISLAALNSKIISTLNYIKAKCAFYYLGSTVAAKVSVSLAVTVLAAGAVSSSTMHNNENAAEQSSLPAQYSAAPPWKPEPIEECTEQEAIVAAESIGLPDVREKKAFTPVNKKKNTEEAVPEPAEEVVAQPATARQFKIVAVEEAE